MCANHRNSNASNSWSTERHQLAEKEPCGLKSFFAVTVPASSQFLADMPDMHN